MKIRVLRLFTMPRESPQCRCSAAVITVCGARGPWSALLVGVQSTTDWAQTGTQKWGGGWQPQVPRLHRHTIHTAHITHHTPELESNLRELFTNTEKAPERA